MTRTQYFGGTSLDSVDLDDLEHQHGSTRSSKLSQRRMENNSSISTNEKILERSSSSSSSSSSTTPIVREDIKIELRNMSILSYDNDIIKKKYVEEDTNIQYVCSDKEIMDSLNKDSTIIRVDPLRYDIDAEARAPINFSPGPWIEDLLISALSPFSFVYVYLRYGMNGLINYHIIEPRKKKSPSVVGIQMPGIMFFFMNYFFMFAKYVFAYSYIKTWQENDQREKCTQMLPLITFSW
jgi:hypothetical protein